MQRPLYCSFFLIELCLCFPSNFLSFNPCLSSSFSCSLDCSRCCLGNLSGRILCCLYSLTCCLSCFFNCTSCIGWYMAVSDFLSCITNFFGSISCCDCSFVYRLCKFRYSTTLMEFSYCFSCSRRCFTNGFC